jgi:hypoxanthine phosphoribosyltransferase (EC 2.4.2.8)
MRLTGGRGTRRIQDIMVDARIPRALRAEWPLVVAGERIVWLPGIGVAEEVRASTGHAALHLWIEGISDEDEPGGIAVVKEHSMHDDMAKILLTAEQIQERVRALGAQITTDYRPLGDLLLVGVLKGCAMFMVDLARAIDLPLGMDFIATSSYGKTTESSGVVRMLKDLDTDIAGRHVLIVEDIIDSGLTLAYLRGASAAPQPGESAHLRTAQQTGAPPGGHPDRLSGGSTSRTSSLSGMVSILMKSTANLAYIGRSGTSASIIQTA